MTANQINFAKLVEDVRSHKANESYAARQAAAAETQAYASYTQALSGQQQAEAALQNAASNVINAQANQTQAAAAWRQAQTNAMYQTEKVQREKEAQAENIRHNMANEANDTLRINRTYEASLYGADVNRENTLTTAATSERNTDVQTRSNMVTGFGSQLISGVLRILGG